VATNGLCTRHFIAWRNGDDQVSRCVEAGATGATGATGAVEKQEPGGRTKKERIVSDEKIKTCVVPGCDRPAKAPRGLCYACMGYLQSGQDAERLELIRKHRLPSKREPGVMLEGGVKSGKARPKPNVRPVGQSPAVSTTVPPPPPPPGSTRAKNDLSGTVLLTADNLERFAYMLCKGLKVLTFEDHVVFINSSTGKGAAIDIDGNVYRAATAGKGDRRVRRPGDCKS